MASLSRSPFFDAIGRHDPQSVAVVHSKSGRTFSYGSLLADVALAKQRLLQSTGRDEASIAGERIAFLVENSYDYIVTLLSILASNAIAVPLAPSFPPSELQYILNHSQALALLSSAKYGSLATSVLEEGLDQRPVAISLEKINEGATPRPIDITENPDITQGGMMLYTSGTTARPKGVLLDQGVLAAQAQSLLQAWDYSPSDRLLHVLPLHHIHGTVNALLTPVLAGSSIEMMFPFMADTVWRRLATPFAPDLQNHSQKQTPITFFTAVPTIWARLLQSFPKLSPALQTAAKQAIQRQHLRLNISGSAALPTPTKQAWTELSSGNILLERFGMTEVGMALSCGLADSDRLDGSVGWPLPSVEARLVDTDTQEIIPPGSGDIDPATGKQRSGEIQLRGPTIFKSYWRNPTATAAEFTPDGWFKTGDIAVRSSDPQAQSGTGASGSWATGPAYFIHGRKSADIIKTGGEKVSALEIEREILSIPAVAECAVVGLPSETWGQKVAAVIVLHAGFETLPNGKKWGAMQLRRDLKTRLVAYKIPQDVEVVEEIPRNAMGKVNKKELVKAIFGEGEKIRRRSELVRVERERLKREEREAALKMGGENGVLVEEEVGGDGGKANGDRNGVNGHQ